MKAFVRICLTASQRCTIQASPLKGELRKSVHDKKYDNDINNGDDFDNDDVDDDDDDPSHEDGLRCRPQLLPLAHQLPVHHCAEDKF